MMRGSGVAFQILAVLQEWAAWIWSATAAIAAVYCLVFGRQLHTERRRLIAEGSLASDEALSRRVDFFARFVGVAGVLFTSLLAIGIASKVWPLNAWVQIATLVLLLALPPAILWLVFAAMRLRLTER